ncbi:MAG: hypothetical protein JW929_04340 [Anaerolineales bacterium]|nr:hypothetical protein [Anaerolineales bacterium]
MKPHQAALLLGLAALDCFAMAIGVTVIAGILLAAAKPKQTFGGEAQTSPLPAFPPSTLASAIPTVTPRFKPTESASALSPTAEIEVEWRIFSVAEVEISMPATYAAGDPHTEAAAIVAALQELGADFDWTAIEEKLTGAAKSYVLWGIDSRQGNPAVVTNVAVAYDFPSPGESPADYASRFLDSISNQYSLLERLGLAHPAYEVERLLLLAFDEGGAQKQMAVYFVRDGNRIWDIFCYTAADEMETRLPVFDRMVDSFRVRG